MRKAVAVLTFLILSGAMAIPVVGQVVEQTCNDIGFDNLTESVSGEWGSITFAADDPTLTLEVAEGFEVTVCVKAGSAVQGDGPEVLGPFGEGEHVLSHSSLKELSHFGFSFDEIEETTTTQGDEEPTTTTLATTTTTEATTTTTLGTTTTTSGTTTTPPLTLGEIEAVCVSNIPFLSYSVEFPGVTSLSSITFVNPDGPDVIHENPPLTGQVIWPGASENPEDWPGWILGSDGIWVEGDDGFLWARETVTVIFEINPTATLTVDYPPASAICAGPVNPPTGTLTIPTTPDVTSPRTPSPRTPSPEDTLPFTGPETPPKPIGVIAGILMVLGLLTLAAARRGYTDS